MAVAVPTPALLPGHRQDRGAGLVAVYAATLAVAAVLVVMRLYVRKCMLKKLWWDDLFVVIGLLITIVAFALLVVSVDAGIGRHIFDLLPAQISRAVKYELLTRITMGLSMMFTRTSIALLMLRFSGTKKWFEICIYCVIGLILASHIPLAVLGSTRCDPVRKYWMPKVPGHCHSKHLDLSIGYFNCAVSITSDFVLSALPIFFLWHVKISSRTKVAICCLMGVGIFAGACAIVRTAYLYEFDIVDITYRIFDVAVWSTLENNIGIIAACIPTLKPLFKPISHWMRSLTPSKGAYTKYTEGEQHLSTLHVYPKTHASDKTYRSEVESQTESGYASVALQANLGHARK